MTLAMPGFIVKATKLNDSSAIQDNLVSVTDPTVVKPNTKEGEKTLKWIRVFDIR
ncbi:hypothetical protein [Lacticaseibacillus hegangensis]|uniref:hypothetical protein n=1 Tax=Lacticaseibacillus hegangensis TaxID=2486010 RepID=UPI0013DE3832|nr:hypothetical protein [Lacticaseibacillus hegangensis]